MPDPTFTMNKFLVPALVALVIAVGAFGYIQMSSAGDQEALLKQLRDKVAGLEKDRDAAGAAAKARLKDLEDQLASLNRQLNDEKARNKELVENSEKNAGIASADSPAKPGQPQSPDQKALGDLRGLARAFTQGMDDPEFRSMIKSDSLRAVSGAYTSLFEKLGLDEQTSKLAAEIINDRNIAAFDRGRKLLNGNSNEATMAEARKDIEALKTEHDSKLRSLLGEQGFNEFNSYEQTFADQRALESVARSFERNNTPLDQNQRAGLEKIMLEERQKNPIPTNIPDPRGGPGMSMLMTEAEAKANQQAEEAYQARVMSRASQAGLSPDQVNALQDSFKRRNEQQARGRMMGRLFLGGSGGSGGNR
jgi:hypothetical protein